MKYCPKCGAANEDNAKFCAACGDKLPEAATPPAESEPCHCEAHEAPGPVVCASCGAANEPGVIFCANCGERLVGKPPEAYAPPSDFGVPPAQEQPEPAPQSTPTGVCPACGAQNPPTLLFCSACGERLSQPQAEPVKEKEPPKQQTAAAANPAVDGEKKERSPVLWLVINIISTLCCGCCNLVGIVGIVFAAIGMSARNKGDMEKAEKNTKIAMILGIIALIAAAIFAIVVLIMIATALAGGGLAVGALTDMFEDFFY